MSQYAASISLLESFGICGRSRSQLHMTHELAGAFNKLAGSGSAGTVKEPHVVKRSNSV